MHVLALILIVLAGPAAAQGERQWIANTYDGGASLVYGTPDSDDVVIGFGCDTDSNELRVTHMVGEPLEGEETELILTTGETRRALPAEILPTELGAMTGVGATTDFSADLFGLLEGETLTVAVAGQETQVPLAGALDVIDLLVETCSE